MKVGIIGCGTISHCHMAAYKKIRDVEVTAACDISQDRASAFANQYGIAAHFTSYERMLCEASLDAVSVTTWNNAHEPIAIEALKRDVNVLCEKPLALNTRQAREMSIASKLSGKLLMPGFCTRYEDGAKLLKSLADSGELGRLYAIKATFLRRSGNPGSWFADAKRSGGGPVIDLGVHVIDLARYFAGSPAALSVSAVTHRGAGKGAAGLSKYTSVDGAGAALSNVEDSAFALIRFDNGVCVQFETSWVHHIGQDVLQMEVFGDSAGATLYPSVALHGESHSHLMDAQFAHSNHPENPNYDFDQEIAHFIDCIRGDAQPICTAEDGVEVMRIVDAIYASAARGCEVEVER